MPLVLSRDDVRRLLDDIEDVEVVSTDKDLLCFEIQIIARFQADYEESLDSLDEQEVDMHCALFLTEDLSQVKEVKVSKALYQADLVGSKCCRLLERAQAAFL